MNLSELIKKEVKEQFIPPKRKETNHQLFIKISFFLFFILLIYKY